MEFVKRQGGPKLTLTQALRSKMEVVKREGEDFNRDDEVAPDGAPPVER